MLTTFQRAVLGTIAGSAVLLALVVAAGGNTSPAAMPAVIAPQTNGGIAPGIVTVGDATVKIKPDIAILSVGATAQAATAAEAQQQVAKRVGQMLSVAKALGIADGDTKNAGYAISPQYAYDKGQAPRITGYQATQTLTLTLRRTEEAGRALDQLVQGDGATSASVTFALEDPKAAQGQARKLAVDDARSKADAMATQAGVRLGGVISISDQSPLPVPMYEKRYAMAQPAPAADTRIPAGDLEIVIRVQVQFAIQ